MKEVVSVSLGSSRRNHEVDIELLGQQFKIKRIGTNGDFDKAIELLKELDGKVDTFGLGGIDLYLFAPGGKRYEIRDAKKLAAAVKTSGIVDGSGLKNTLERQVIEELQKNPNFNLNGKKVLMVSAVDRFGMADALHKAGAKMIFGDLVFGLNIPLAIRRMTSFKVLARVALPIVTKMPFKILYPTGSEQEKEPKKKYIKYYEEADIIAGDYLFIRKYLPKDLTGKIILTNTTTPEDVDDLQKRGVRYLITTTPELGGRSFGTNVMEAMLVTALNTRPDVITSKDYEDILEKLEFKPRIEELNEGLEAPSLPGTRRERIKQKGANLKVKITGRDN